jgi:hypothetical protein
MRERLRSRHFVGGSPNSRLKARLKAASGSSPTSKATGASLPIIHQERASHSETGRPWPGAPPIGLALWPAHLPTAARGLGEAVGISTRVGLALLLGYVAAVASLRTV